MTDPTETPAAVAAFDPDANLVPAIRAALALIADHGGFNQAALIADLREQGATSRRLPQGHYHRLFGIRVGPTQAPEFPVDLWASAARRALLAAGVGS